MYTNFTEAAYAAIQRLSFSQDIAYLSKAI